MIEQLIKLGFKRYNYEDENHFKKYNTIPFVMYKELPDGSSIEWEPILDQLQKFDAEGKFVKNVLLSEIL